MEAITPFCAAIWSQRRVFLSRHQTASSCSAPAAEDLLISFKVPRVHETRTARDSGASEILFLRCRRISVTPAKRSPRSAFRDRWGSTRRTGRATSACVDLVQRRRARAVLLANARRRRGRLHCLRADRVPSDRSQEQRSGASSRHQRPQGISRRLSGMQTPVALSWERVTGT